MAFSQAQLRSLRARANEAKGISEVKGLKILQRIGIATSGGRIKKQFLAEPGMKARTAKKTRKAP